MAGSSVSPVVDDGVAATRTGRYAILEQLLADDIGYIFGNPGTVEQGFLDALGSYPDLQYILTLQETIAVAIADGYARARHRPAVVQLHSGVGLGNGVGMLYQAKRGGTPLVVIAGESGVRYDAMDAQMAADLVSIARPVTKWATRVVDPGSVLRVLRRAIKIAGTAPTGPVFVCLPADVLDAPNSEPVVPTSMPATRVVAGPGRSSTRRPTLLAGAERPIIIMGDGIAMSGAQAELTAGRRAPRRRRLGRQLVRGQLRRSTHPLFRGNLGHMFGHHSRPLVAPGGRGPHRRDLRLPRGLPDPDRGLRGGRPDRPHRPRRLRDRQELPGRSRARQRPEARPWRPSAPPSTGRLGDRRAIGGARPASPPAPPSASRRPPRCAPRTSRRAGRSRSTPPSSWRPSPARLPEDAIIFDEALTFSPEVTQYLPPRRPGLVLPDPWRLARGRDPRRHRGQAGASRSGRSSGSPATAAACTRSRPCGPPPTTGSARSS